jgi:S1-C subfamily serine protease
LIEYGRYLRPTLGITGNTDLSRRLLAELSVEGVLVLEVVPGSGAARAGLRATEGTPGGSVVLGDVIQAIDGRAVATFEELSRTLDDYRVGDTVSLGIWRNGEQVTVQARLEAPRGY